MKRALTSLVCIALLGATAEAALAAAPTLTSVTVSPARQLTATWTLPPGAESRELRISESNVPSEFFGLEGGGYAYMSVFGDFSTNATSFTTPPLEPGVLYVRVGAYDPNDPPDIRWSNILSVTIASQCTDGVDNDGDGKIDAADGGCTGTTDDDDETGPPAPPGLNLPAAAGVLFRGVDGLRPVRADGVQVGIMCPRACRAATTLLMARKAARKLGIVSAAVRVGRGTATMGAAGYDTFAATLTRKARKKLKKARAARLKVRTVLTGTDGAALGTFVRRIKLVRRTPANRAPSFPAAVSTSHQTTYEYDHGGRLMGGYTKLVVNSRPADPDGDPLTYQWTSSRGEIVGVGLNAVWRRTVDLGQLAAGMVTLTVKDRRGGSDSFTFDFRRGAG